MFVIKFYTSELLGTIVLHTHNIEKQYEINFRMFCFSSIGHRLFVIKFYTSELLYYILII